MKKLSCGILLFISVLIWGITFVAQSDASAHIEPFTFNFVRFLIGSAVLLPFIPIFGRFEAKKQQTARRLIQPRQLMKKKQFKKAACRRHSFGHHALHCLKFAAIGHYKRRPVGKAGFITSVYIMLVPVVGLFFKKKTHPLIWLCAVVSAVGLYF